MKTRLLLIVLLILTFFLLTACSGDSSRENVSEIKIHSSNVDSLVSSLPYIDDNTDSSSYHSSQDEFYIGTWEYITSIPNTLLGATSKYSSNIYSYTFSDDKTVSTYLGWPNSDIAVLYEGSYEIIDADDDQAVLQLDLHQAFPLSDDMASHAADDTVNITLSIYLFGPQYRITLSQTDGDTIYSEQEFERPFWYTKVEY